MNDFLRYYFIKFRKKFLLIKSKARLKKLIDNSDGNFIKINGLLLQKNDQRALQVLLKSQILTIKTIKKLNKKFSPDIFIDIGANYGEFSNALSKFFKQIYSFEPNPFIFKCLAENTKKFKNINIYNKAVVVGGSKNITDLNIDMRNSGGSSIVNKNNVNDFSYVLDVQTYDVPKIVKLINKKRTFFKIDTEGYDFYIVNELLSRMKDRFFIIIFELNVNYHSKSSVLEYFDDYSTKKNIKIFLINHYLERLESYSRSKLTSNFNYEVILINDI